MRGWTFETIAEEAGGRWVVAPGDGARPPTGAAIDTRTLKPGDLFAAYVGARADGHTFLPDAEERGAAMALVTDEDAVPASVTVPTLLVRDMTAALTALAALKRRLMDAKVVGVTGSNGKTTSVRLLSAVLARAGRVASSGRSFNNEIGVPVTVLDAPWDAEYLVCEIGTSTPGEVAARAELVRPDVSVITSIGRAHLEELGSIEGISREKASILRHTQTLGVIPGGVRVLDDALVSDPPACRVVPVDPARVVIIGTSASLTSFTLDGDAFSLAAPGAHNAMNAALCVVAAGALGVNDEQIRAGLAEAALPEMRLDRIEIATASDPIVVYNDAYNANPDSVRASLTFFLESTPAPRVVVLGDMLELGAYSEREHTSLLVDLSALESAARVVTVGDAFAHAPGPRWVERSAESDDAVLEEIARSVRPGDHVLLKGSRGIALERLVPILTQVHGSKAASA